MSKNLNLAGNLFTKPKRGLTIKETPLSASIAEWLDVHRIENDRINCGKVKVIKSYFNKTQGKWIDYPPFWMQLSKDGTPDRFAIVDGRIIYIEVKQKGKQPTELQLNRQNELRHAGAIVIVADSFDSFVVQFKEAVCEIKSKFVPTI